jgi:DNA (cytosine-5)-methyltransferase 1
MRVLDLFSGIGGFSLGLERAGMETVAFCEYDKKAQLVLKKHWPEIPIYDDVRTLTYEKLKEDGIITDTSGVRCDSRWAKQPLQGIRASSETRQSKPNRTITEKTNSIDLICGGFPCQPFSVAGKQKGSEDDRHLWPEYFRLIQEIRPRWVIGENVAGLINMGLDQVLFDLESANYSCQTLIIPACALNAPHRRDRVWIVAHAASAGGARRADDKANGCGGVNGGQASKVQRGNESTEDVPHSGGNKRVSGGQSIKTLPLSLSIPWTSGFWAVEPEVGRVANGVPRTMDQLKQLGNAVVPQIPEIIGTAIMEIESYL